MSIAFLLLAQSASSVNVPSQGGFVRRLAGFILIILIIAFALPATAMKPPRRAPAPPPPEEVAASDGTFEPAVRIKPPGSYTAKRIVLFPFEIPSYAFRAVLFPLGEGLGLMQRERLIERFEDTVSFKSKQIWVYPVFDLSPGASFGGGPAVKVINLFDKGIFMDGSYRVHVNLDMFGDFSFRKEGLFHAWNLPVDLAFDGTWRLIQDFGYYGIGNESQTGNQYTFREQDWNGVARLALRPIPELKLYALLGVSATATGDASNFTATSAPFPPTGYGRWLPYVRIGVGFAHDTRDVPQNTRRGGLRSFEFNRFQYAGGGNFSYNDLQFTVAEFLPLWSPDHTLMLRTSWWIEQSGSTIPVPRMTALDADHWLRGYDRGRLRDRASAVFNFQYFFPVFPGLRGTIFADTGRVFDGLKNFTVKNFKYSAGGGFDITAGRLVALRFLAAYGGEGVKFFFSLLRTTL